MAKSKTNVPDVNDLLRDLNSGKLLPVYFIFGEDSFGVEEALAAIEKKTSTLVESDFDKQVFQSEETTVSQVLDFAAAFPFGGGKKYILLKEFEKVKDKKSLTPYALSPSEFTILVIVSSGSITGLASEPYKTLAAGGYLFEAKELKGAKLVNWVTELAVSRGKTLTHDNARLLMDISGEDRSALESQLEKIITYLGDENEIGIDAIRGLSTRLKEFTIFDLQNAVGRKDKAAALKIALNMFEKGAEPVYLIHMLTRFFTGLAKTGELLEKRVPDQSAARIVGTHPYYYKDYISAWRMYGVPGIITAAQSLLKADMTLKTTSADEKSLITILISEIIETK